MVAHIRDVNDVIVMRTAIIGEADIPCTRDEDFFAKPANNYLRKMGIAALDDSLSDATPASPDEADISPDQL